MGSDPIGAVSTLRQVLRLDHAETGGAGKTGMEAPVAAGLIGVGGARTAVADAFARRALTKAGKYLPGFNRFNVRTQQDEFIKMIRQECPGIGMTELARIASRNFLGFLTMLKVSSSTGFTADSLPAQHEAGAIKFRSKLEHEQDLRNNISNDCGGPRSGGKIPEGAPDFRTMVERPAFIENPEPHPSSLEPEASWIPEPQPWWVPVGAGIAIVLGAVAKAVVTGFCPASAGIFLATTPEENISLEGIRNAGGSL